MIMAAVDSSLSPFLLFAILVGTVLLFTIFLIITIKYRIKHWGRNYEEKLSENGEKDQ